jgi:hypothetical protein
MHDSQLRPNESRSPKHCSTNAKEKKKEIRANNITELNLMQSHLSHTLIGPSDCTLCLNKVATASSLEQSACKAHNRSGEDDESDKLIFAE